MPRLLQFHLYTRAEIQTVSAPIRPELCRLGSGQSTKITSHLGIRVYIRDILHWLPPYRGQNQIQDPTTWPDLVGFAPSDI